MFSLGAEGSAAVAKVVVMQRYDGTPKNLSGISKRRDARTNNTHMNDGAGTELEMVSTLISSRPWWACKTKA